ncbi:MAG: HD domain-containing protein [Lachnospiraceae bacterium]|nr:HD domain-containing protein [Lachnospiraceae bacterium]
MNFDDRIPAGARRIIEQLNNAGFEAYIVGGCVRDLVLGRTPCDWDITTSALPEQVKAVFKRTVDTGIKHGTVTVLMRDDHKQQGYEVTTYRIDGVYEDCRHPKEVEFTANLEEDLKRRDFTVNAMAYAPGEGIVDMHGGMEDLKEGVIRCVGDAKERFTEDALRMMRAIRFSAQLDARIEEDTWNAIRELAPNIRFVSAERIRVEAEKLLISDHPYRFKLFYESGLTKYFFPEWEVTMKTTQENPHHAYTVGEHLLHSLESINTELLKKEYSGDEYVKALRMLRLTMLLHDISKPAFKTVDEQGVAHFKGHPHGSAKMADEILHRLKYDNDTIKSVVRLVENHEDRFETDERSLRRAINRMGEECFPLIFYIQEADCLAQSTYMREEKLARIAGLREHYPLLLAKKQCISIKDLAVDGRDLMEAGVKPGPEMGRILAEMLDDVLDEPEHNDRQYLLERYVYEKKA